MTLTYDIRFSLKGSPITKKNSQKIILVAGRPRIAPSQYYNEYRERCLWMIPGSLKRIDIDSPVNLKCVYYMPTRRKVDLCNLLEATCDILVDAGVLNDDNSSIVVGHDGSRVLYDKENPRVEIEIHPIVLS